MSTALHHNLFAKERPLRVLVLPSYYPLDDEPWIGIFFKEQSEALSSVGVQVHVAYVETKTLRHLSVSKLLQRRFQIVEHNENGLLTLRQRGWNPHIRSGFGGAIWTSLTRKLVKRYIATHGRPDVIHAHNAIWAGNAARELKQELGIPFVVTEHSTAALLDLFTPVAQRASVSAYREADCVITVGGELARQVRGFAPTANVKVVPNVIDTDFFSLPPEPRQPEPFVFVSVAHLVHRKGFDLLLKAFAEQFANEKAVSLRIGGEGPERQNIEAQIRELGLEGRVELLGRVSREEVRQLMWSGNAFALASRAETFGVVLVEALSTGLPLVTTDCGGPRDVMTPDIGRMVASEDVQALGRAMREVREMRSEPTVLRNSAVSRFGVKAVTEQLIKIYSDIVPTLSAEAQQ